MSFLSSPYLPFHSLLFYFVVFLCLFLFSLFTHVLPAVCIACNPWYSALAWQPVTTLHIQHLTKCTWSLVGLKEKSNPSCPHCDSSAGTDVLLCSEHAWCSRTVELAVFAGLCRLLRSRFLIWVTAHINRDNTNVVHYFHKVSKRNA